MYVARPGMPMRSRPREGALHAGLQQVFTWMRLRRRRGETAGGRLAHVFVEGRGRGLHRWSGNAWAARAARRRRTELLQSGNIRSYATWIVLGSVVAIVAFVEGSR